MPPASPSTKLRGIDRQYFHAGFTQEGVGVHIPVVSHNDTRLQGHHVIAVVPLLALGGESLATRRHDAKLIQPQSTGHRVDK